MRPTNEGAVFVYPPLPPEPPPSELPPPPPPPPHETKIIEDRSESKNLFFIMNKYLNVKMINLV